MIINWFDARLEGGPFDGDFGQMQAEVALPADLWTCRCRAAAQYETGAPRSSCDYAEDCDGVHWWESKQFAEGDPDRSGAVEHYILGRFERPDDPEAVYIYGDLVDDEMARFARAPAEPECAAA